MSSPFILVVEDSEDDERLTLRALRGIVPPYSVKVARDGAEAAEFLGLGRRENSDVERPALILLDIQMPKLNGFDLLGMIRNDKTMGPTKVVVFTSSNQKEDVDRAHQLHAEYQQKPMEYAEYLDAVRAMVQNALLGAHNFAGVQ
jgi:CheY-like chemotaxis protein